MIRGRAPAKVNLVLRSGPPRADGLQPLASLFASIDLADEVTVEEAERDAVVCLGVEGENLAARAVAVYRAAAGARGGPPVLVRIEKRIPVAAGLGGGSADAAAVLRALDAMSGEPLGTERLRELAAGLGSDVPSQVDPRHALVTGVGERVEALELPAFALVVLPASRGLSTADVYRQLDHLGAWREELDPDGVRALASAPLPELAAGLENDLQAAALSLRPELEGSLRALRELGAPASGVSGSGPTTFGLFPDAATAERAAASIPGGLVARPLSPA